MSSEMKIDWFPPGKNLSEIYQEVDTKFAFAFMSDGGILTQSHPWAKCRDFLHDAVAGELHGYDVRIWNFEFNKKANPKRDRVCLDKTLMMISKKNLTDSSKFEEKLLRGIGYVNYYEKMLGLPLTTLTRLPKNTVDTNYEKVWLLDGPKFWITAPHLISLLTFIIRLGEKLPAYKDGIDVTAEFKKIADDEKYGEFPKDNDVKYLRQCYTRIEKVLHLTGKIEEEVGTDNGFLKTYSWQGNHYSTSQRQFHDKSGILSVCTGNTWLHSLNKLLNSELLNK